MRPLSEFPAFERAQVRAVLADIDDTLTTGGRLTAEAYGALERLQAAGLLVVPVTGRPAGWCDHIARMWPVDGVVGENGAFWFRYERARREMRRGFVQDAELRARARQRLEAIGQQILAAVPGCAIASDQRYREADLAIDFCEDVAPLPGAAVTRIVELMRSAGLTVRVSSIHVNGWFGEYDKLGMSRRFLGDQLGIDIDADASRVVFVGDSPNDAPMFAHFPNSVGVANVSAFAGQLEAEPTYVTRCEAGAGFTELAAALLEARS